MLRAITFFFITYSFLERVALGEKEAFSPGGAFVENLCIPPSASVGESVYLHTERESVYLHRERVSISTHRERERERERESFWYQLLVQILFSVEVFQNRLKQVIGHTLVSLSHTSSRSCCTLLHTHRTSHTHTHTHTHTLHHVERQGSRCTNACQTDSHLHSTEAVFINTS